MSPDTINTLGRAHKRQVLETYRIYGQLDGIDQPEDSDHLPLNGAGALIRNSASRLFEMLVIVLVAILVIGLSLTGGPTS